MSFESLYALAVNAGCRPVWQAGIDKGAYAFVLHCNCLGETNHGDAVRRITPESLKRGK